MKRSRVMQTSIYGENGAGFCRTASLNYVTGNLILRSYFYSAAFVLIYFHLTKDRDTFFQPNTIDAKLLSLMMFIRL